MKRRVSPVSFTDLLLAWVLNFSKCMAADLIQSVFGVPVCTIAVVSLGGALSLACDTTGSPQRGTMFEFLFGSDCKFAEVWLLRE